ncbi:hypothetical protein P618_200341 [Holospora obtusa F1]|uniref:Uncharacterized protein n=1 Tax=Holospora obtusa F1 TaxID=1399147 RepID=W6TEX3_HOLOB|nr:hypothetical protein P618_200341 [Holospora obtusa F1]
MVWAVVWTSKKSYSLFLIFSRKVLLLLSEVDQCIFKILEKCQKGANVYFLNLFLLFNRYF